MRGAWDLAAVLAVLADRGAASQCGLGDALRGAGCPHRSLSYCLCQALHTSGFSM